MSVVNKRDTLAPTNDVFIEETTIEISYVHKPK